MREKQKKSITIPAAPEGFEPAHSFIGTQLKRDGISKEIIAETMLVFEALFHKILEQDYGEDTQISITRQNRFGEIYIKIGFEGKMFVLTNNNEGEPDPENSILKAYDDKLDYSYRAGYNIIRITGRRSIRRTMAFCGAGLLLAILVYFLISSYGGLDNLQAVQDRVVLPLERLFTNAILMVGAPATFFSLLKNLTDTYIVAERNSGVRKMQVKTLITSVIAVVLGVAMSSVVILLVSAQAGRLYAGDTLSTAQSFSELVSSLVPTSILSPFESIMPFPLIIVALLVTYALCSIGKYFDKMKKAINACYTLFSKMLNVVMYTLPFFCFLAFLGALLKGGYTRLLMIITIVLLIIASLLVLAVFYLIRLAIGGVAIGPFLKHLPKLLHENFKINSVIDAVPFNIRYCVRNYGMNRKRLEEKLPVLAQINLDGNCYLVMLLDMIFLFLLGMPVSWFDILVIAILVVFLSFGAPNQPGTILIGTLIIARYLNADVLLPVAIYMEVFLGSVQNITNVVGDIVMVAIEEQKVVSEQKSAS